MASWRATRLPLARTPDAFRAMKRTPKTAAALSRYTVRDRCIDLCAIGLFGALLLWSMAQRQREDSGQPL